MEQIHWNYLCTRAHPLGHWSITMATKNTVPQIEISLDITYQHELRQRRRLGMQMVQQVMTKVAWD